MWVLSMAGAGLQHLGISFYTTTALSTKAESIALPSVALPVHFDQVRQREAWQTVGQVGRVTQIVAASHKKDLVVAQDPR
jgi:hypothetical protein